jgi:hypothetical protein
MRIRSIKPEFWGSPDVADMSLATRLVFIGLWSLADDEGRFLADPRWIRSELFPLDEHHGDDSVIIHGGLTEASVSLHDALTQLSNGGQIVLFRGENGRIYGEVVHWSHQKINRPSKSKIPAPTRENTILTEGSVNTHGGLTEDSSPDQGSGIRDQGSGNNTPPLLSEDRSALVPVGAVADAPETSKRAKAPTEPDGFDEFYEAYPRRTGRRKAAQEFAKATKEATPAELVTAAIAFRQACQHNRTEQKFIPHPATWLHQGRWAEAPEVLEDRPASGPDWDAMMADAAAEDAARGLA